MLLRNKHTVHIKWLIVNFRTSEKHQSFFTDVKDCLYTDIKRLINLRFVTLMRESGRRRRRKGGRGGGGGGRTRKRFKTGKPIADTRPWLGSNIIRAPPDLMLWTLRTRLMLISELSIELIKWDSRHRHVECNLD